MNQIKIAVAAQRLVNAAERLIDRTGANVEREVFEELREAILTARKALEQ